MISDTDIGNTIRHLGFGVLGLAFNTPSGQSMAYGGSGYRYFSTIAPLLYRLRQMSPENEARLTGRKTAAIAFSGTQPKLGDSITVTIAWRQNNINYTETVTYSVDSWNPAKPTTLLNVCGGISQALNLNQNIMGAGFFIVAPYGTGNYANTQVQLPLVSISGPCCVDFTVSTSYSGGVAPQLQLSGTNISPYLSFRTGGQVTKIWGYLPILDYLEGAYGGATINLSASEIKEQGIMLNHDELNQRNEQYEKFRSKLSQFLGSPINPEIDASDMLHLSLD